MTASGVGQARNSLPVQSSAKNTTSVLAQKNGSDKRMMHMESNKDFMEPSSKAGSTNLINNLSTSPKQASAFSRQLNQIS